MINNSRGKKIKAKQEGDTNDIKLWKTTTSSSRQLARFSNPRIVRVSRSFGGKDRHSKVFTIRGLRDRRIRLSVPTAIQLYDLQEKLGLSQPSKVIDWLLEANEHEIDKLPPLQMPLGDFSQFHEQTLVPHELNAPQPLFNLNAEFMKDRGNSKYLTNSDADSSRKYIEIGRENIFEHNRWNITRNEQETQENPQHSAQNLFPSANQCSFPPNNTSSYNCDPSNLSLSQFGNQGFPSWFPSQGDTHNTTQSASLPSSQLFFCPPAIAPSFFPPYMMSTNSSVEGELRNSNQFQFLSATSQNVVPNSLVSPLRFISPFNANPKVNLQNNNDTNKASSKYTAG